MRAGPPPSSKAGSMIQVLTGLPPTTPLMKRNEESGCTAAATRAKNTFDSVWNCESKAFGDDCTDTPTRNNNCTNTIFLWKANYTTTINGEDCNTPCSYFTNVDIHKRGDVCLFGQCCYWAMTSPYSVTKLTTATISAMVSFFCCCDCGPGPEVAPAPASTATRPAM